MNTIPPLTQLVVEQLRTIIESAATIETPLRAWGVSLACGHVLAYRQHASLHAPDVPNWFCPTCGQRRRLVQVTPRDDTSERDQQHQAACLELRRASEAVDRARRQLARAEQRLAQARLRLVDTGHDPQTLHRAPPAGGEADVIDTDPRGP